MLLARNAREVEIVETNELAPLDALRGGADN
jgi:hypothetical protein